MNLAPAAPIDLQLHTHLSDGAWTPEALIDTLKQAGFAAAAITDHDRVDVVPMLQQIAADRDFLLLPAVEMSTHWRDEMVDVLCFGFEHDPSHLLAVADTLLCNQQDNIWQTVRAIAAQGYPLPEAAVQQIVATPSVQQPHNLVALVKEHGYETPELSAGRLLVGAGLKIITTPIAEVVTAVHKGGGVCLIAHPGRGDGFMNFDETLLDELRAEVPIDGLEVYYPKHESDQIGMFRAYAKQHNLLTSAGSDSHAPEHPPIKFRADTSRALLERLGISVG